MKRLGESIFFAVVIIVLGCTVSAVWDHVYAQNPSGGLMQGPAVVNVKQPQESSRWIVDFTLIPNPTSPTRQLQVITVVDPESKRICVYHADLPTGTVELCSVRHIRGDLEFTEFNPTPPTPRDIEENIKKFRRQNQIEERVL